MTNVLSSDPLSYKAPIITNVPGFNSMATGTPTQIYIDGKILEMVGSTILLLYNTQIITENCIRRLHTNDTHTHIMQVSRGIGTELQWIVTVGLQTSANFQ